MSLSSRRQQCVVDVVILFDLLDALTLNMLLLITVIIIFVIFINDVQMVDAARCRVEHLRCVPSRSSTDQFGRARQRQARTSPTWTGRAPVAGSTGSATGADATGRSARRRRRAHRRRGSRRRSARIPVGRRRPGRDRPPRVRSGTAVG